MTQATQLAITHSQVNLVSVSGRLDRAGLRTLQKQLDILLDAGTRFLLTDLPLVEHCDNRLAELLGRTSTLMEQRGGWLRLTGPQRDRVGVTLLSPPPTCADGPGGLRAAPRINQPCTTHNGDR